MPSQNDESVSHNEMAVIIGSGKKVSAFHDFMPQYEMLCKQIDDGGPVGKACSDIMKKGLQTISTEMNSSYSHPKSHEYGMASPPTLSSNEKNHIERDPHAVHHRKKGKMENPYLVRAMS